MPTSPLFASTELVARIERSERQLIADGADAVSKRGADGLFSAAIAGGIATWTGDGSPLNKVAGVGFEGPLDPDLLEAVEKQFCRRGAPIQVELSTLAHPSIAPMLTRRGYVLQGFEDVLGRRLSIEAGSPPADVDVSATGDHESELWIDTVVTGFIHPDTQGVPSSEEFPRQALEQIFKDMAATDAFRSFLARRGDVVAGGGSMRIWHGIATLCGAATLPEHRRRGVQSTLLDVRLQAAAEAGCELAVVTTQPGSKSQENVKKKGFHLLYTRAILVREA